MDQAAKYEELAALLKAERDNQLNKISAGAAERGPGLAGPTGAVGVYNQDRFVRPTIDPLIEGLVVKAKQAALQEQLKQLADAASSRYQRAASAYAAKQAAAASGSSPLTSPGDNTIVEKTAPVAPDAVAQPIDYGTGNLTFNESNKLLSDLNYLNGNIINKTPSPENPGLKALREAIG